VLYTFFKQPHRKKSGAVRSGERGGHGTSPKREITRCGNKRRSAAMLITAVWAVAYLNIKTAYVQIPALRDTLAEKHVTKILKCFTISAATSIYLSIYPSIYLSVSVTVFHCYTDYWFRSRLSTYLPVNSAFRCSIVLLRHSFHSPSNFISAFPGPPAS